MDNYTIRIMDKYNPFTVKEIYDSSECIYFYKPHFGFPCDFFSNWNQIYSL